MPCSAFASEGVKDDEPVSLHTFRVVGGINGLHMQALTMHNKTPEIAYLLMGPWLHFFWRTVCRSQSWLWRIQCLSAKSSGVEYRGQSRARTIVTTSRKDLIFQWTVTLDLKIPALLDA